MYSKLAQKPLVLELNRIMRLYEGGKGLDKWQGISPETDSYMSEDMSVNTAKYIGPGKPYDDGYSQTLIDGEKHRLKTIIESNTDSFLGKKYGEITEGQSGVCCRTGDSKARLILQYHPTNEFARKYFNVPFGKSETWYIVDTRDTEGNCYVGLKKDVTREKFLELFQSQDIDGMLGCLHNIPFKKGELIHVPAGTIHAMGGGTTFLEVHQPCDYTMRFEKNFMGQTINEDSLHYGLGVDKLFEGMRFDTYTDEEIIALVKPLAQTRKAEDSLEVKTLLSKESCPDYTIEKWSIKNKALFNKNTNHCIMIMTKGTATLKTDDYEVEFLQGRSAFIPAELTNLEIIGSDVEIIIAYPFEV